MKKYVKEIFVLLIQLFMFYIFPLFAGPTDAMGMVVLILASTVILAIIFGYISEVNLKYIYPVIISIIFLPSIPIYYNASALVHALWYFISSSVGLIIGLVIKPKKQIS